MYLQSILPDVLVPKELTVNEVTTSSAHLSWTLPHEMDLTSHSFLISYSSEGKDERFISTSSCSTVITGLQPDTDYTVNVSVVCHSGICQPASITIHTSMSVTILFNYLSGTVSTILDFMKMFQKCSQVTFFSNLHHSQFKWVAKSACRKR